MPIYQSTLLGFQGDPRDFIYAPLSTTLPKRIDLRGYAGSIENQSTINSCTANCVVSACEIILDANGQFENLSRIFNYYESRKYAGLLNQDVGSFLRSAVQAAYKVGLPSEIIYPYDITKINTQPTQEAYTDAATKLITRYERIWDGFDYTWNATDSGASIPSGAVSTIGSNQWIRDIKSALSEGYPVVVGFAITNAFMSITGNFDSQYSRPYKGVTSTDPSQGGHAVVIVGYDDNYDSFIIENSWGTGWGYGGYALFPYTTSTEFTEAWVIKGFKGLAAKPAQDSTDTTNPITLVDPKYNVPVLPVVSSDPVYYFNGAYQMAVTSTDLVWRKSKLVSSVAAQNGGVMDYSSTVTTNVKNNLFPDVSQVERTNGSVVFRKVFLHINKNAQEELLNSRISIGALTPAQDFCVFYEGTKSDVESAMSATRCYGAGTLAGAISVGATSLQVASENADWFAANQPFKADDLICITDGTNTNFVKATNVSHSNGVFTLTTQATTNAFNAGALVASVFEVGSVKANYAAPVITSASGTFDSTNNIVVNARGCIDQVWTLTFSNATQFSIAGDTLGTVGVGTISSDTTPSNTAVSAPYFQLKASGFGGTWVAGDKIVFSTSSATIPLWLSRIVPAGCQDVSNNYASLSLAAESY